MRNAPLINKTAPSFEAVDVFGKKINLADFKENYVLLVFLRYSGCPFCNLAIHRLSLEYERLQKQNCQIIAFVQSHKENVIKNIYDRHKLRPQFPIIADHEMQYYKQYGVDTSVSKISLETITKMPHWLHAVRELGYTQQGVDGKFFLMPAWFLINTSTNTVIKSERGVSFYDHETFINVYDSLIFKD